MGIDFFCGLTFPVKEDFCSFIVGGWAGAVVGLSTIDGLDASENETTKLMRFEKDEWYKIKLRVTFEKIETWINEGKGGGSALYRQASRHTPRSSTIATVRYRNLENYRSGPQHIFKKPIILPFAH